MSRAQREKAKKAKEKRERETFTLNGHVYERCLCPPLTVEFHLDSWPGTCPRCLKRIEP